MDDTTPALPLKPTDYDPKWKKVPTAATVIAALAALPMLFLLFMMNFAWSDSCGLCDEQLPIVVTTTSCAIGALVCTVLTWTWPPRRRFRAVRTLFLWSEVILILLTPFSFSFMGS